MKTLKLKRVSAIANQFNNYCYVILEGDTTGISGIVERDGVKMLFSFSRVGSLSKGFTAQLDERKVGDKTFLNLVDTASDAIGEVAHIAATAKRAGIGASAVDAEAARVLFGNLGKGKAQSQAGQEQPVVTEAPKVEETTAGASVAGEE